MKSITLLRLAERALNAIPNRRGIAGLDGPDVPHPFNGVFSSYALAAAIGEHLRDNAGFTVILGYPDSSETYSSSSGAKTWQEAVVDVAEQMLADRAVTTADELTLVDVMEGREDHSTYSTVDRSSVVRFHADSGKACLLSGCAAAAIDAGDREFFAAADRLIKQANTPTAT